MYMGGILYQPTFQLFLSIFAFLVRMLVSRQLPTRAIPPQTVHVLLLVCIWVVFVEPTEVEGRLIPQSHLLYGGRTVAIELQNRVIPAVAAGPPYGESPCFTGRRGGRRIIARSYNFFNFYVRRRNLTRRSHAVDRTVAVRSPCGRLAYALIFVIKTTAAAGTPYGHRASSPQRT